MTARTTAARTVAGPDAGTLSVDGPNIFAILKDSLYGESDIVFRELVANAADAVAKRVAAGDSAAGEVVVVIDPQACTITVDDDGIGMDRGEVDRYINQIALSGTRQFVAECAQPGAVTVGSFGVGFYSAFMIADTVEIVTRSENGAPAVRWTGQADMTWRIEPAERAQTGTRVLLHLDAGSPYLADPARVVAALERYFPFPHVRIVVRSPQGETAVGDLAPVWRRPAEDVDDDEMRAFHRRYVGAPADPVGWARIESPDLGLRGVVFYRDTRGGVDALDGTVTVLSRGVRIDDPVGMVPKFAALQDVVLECDQLPLVVSRAQVRTGQGDQDVPTLVHECLSQELAIAMHAMFTRDRAGMERTWTELAPFVKYGVLTDRTFASVMLRKVLYPTLTGDLCTLAEYQERLPERFAGTVFYTSDPVGQAPYVQAFRTAGIPALVLEHVIDNPMMQRVELVTKDTVFVRLDADVARALAADPHDGDDDLARQVGAVVEQVTARRLPGAAVRPVRLLAPELAVMVTADEVERRIGEMRQLGSLVTGRADDTGAEPARTVLVNLTSPLVGGLRAVPPDRAALAAEHLLDLALLASDELDADDLLAFLARSETLLAAHLGTATTGQE